MNCNQRIGIAALVGCACVVMSARADGGAGEPASGPAVKPLFGFEKDQIAAHGAKVEPVADSKPEAFTATFGTYRGIGTIERGKATEGEWALVRTLADRYNYLRPGNQATYYNLVRTGGLLKTWGWFARILGTDWRGYDRLWIDALSEDGAVRVRVEFEDDTLPEPVARTFDLPKGRWVTLEVDLAAAERAVHLDLGNLRALDVLAVARLDAPPGCRVLLDNIRLACADAEPEREVLRDPTPIRLAERTPGEPARLAPLDISATTAPQRGQVGRISFDRPAAYGLMTAMDRALGRFGDGGIVLVAASRAFVSLDGGANWSGLDGQPAGTVYSRDHRGHHRAAALVEGSDFFAVYTTSHCAGGAGRTAALFSRGIRGADAWTLGPEVVLDSGVRHCHSGFSLARGGGILWAAWSHTGTDLSTSPWALETRARWSPDDGRTWLASARGGTVGPQQPNSGGTLLVPCGDGQVALFWRHANRDLVVARAHAVRAKVRAVEGGRVVLDGGEQQGLQAGAECLVRLPDGGSRVLRLVRVGPRQADGVVVGEQATTEGIAAGAEALSMRWGEPVKVAGGDANPGGPISAAAVGGSLFVATRAHDKVPSAVFRVDGEQVRPVTPADFQCVSPLLISAAGRLAMVWLEGGHAVRFSVMDANGQWRRPETVLQTTEPMETLIAPQSADGFIPVAVGMKDRRTVLATAVPLSER